jgi:hypothetical protein
MNEAAEPGLSLERLTLVGPVASSVDLDMPRLLDDGLSTWEQGASHGGAAPSAWVHVSRVSHGSGMLFDIDTYAGAGLPDSLAVRKISTENGDADLLERLDRQLSPLAVDDAELRLYDFGAVVLWVTARVPLSASGKSAAGVMVLPASQAVRWVEERSSLLCAAEVDLARWCSESLRDLLTTIPPELLASPDPEGVPGVWAPPPEGQVLWLHRVPVFRSSDGSDTLCGRASELLGLSCDLGIEYGGPQHRVAVFPGQGTSVIVVDEGDPRAISESFTRVMALQTAYWTIGQQLGSLILRDSNHFSVLSRDRNMKDLRKEGDHLITLSQEFTLYRSLLTEHVTRLAPADAIRWDHIARAWDLSGFLAQLDKRLEDFGQLGDRFLQRMQEEASARLNAVVIILTIVSGVGTVAALVDFATRRSPGTAQGGNVLILVVAGVLISVLVLSLTAVRARLNRGVTTRAPSGPRRPHRR